MLKSFLEPNKLQSFSQAGKVCQEETLQLITNRFKLWLEKHACQITNRFKLWLEKHACQNVSIFLHSSLFQRFVNLICGFDSSLTRLVKFSFYQLRNSLNENDRKKEFEFFKRLLKPADICLTKTSLKFESLSLIFVKLMLRLSLIILDKVHLLKHKS